MVTIYISEPTILLGEEKFKNHFVKGGETLGLTFDG